MAEQSTQHYQREASAALEQASGFAGELERRRLMREGWPEACLVTEKKAGHRAARLYPLLNVPNGVRTPLGPGTLLQAFDDSPGRPGAMVAHLRPRSWIWEKGKKRAAADFVSIEDVKPYVNGGS